MRRRLLCFLLTASMATLAAAEAELPNVFQAGDPSSADEVNANFEALQSAINDNVSRLNKLDPVVEPAQLAFQLNDDSTLMPLRSASDGGRERTSGGLLQPRPLQVHGLPGALTELIRMLDEGRRFDGRVLRLAGDTGTALIALNNTRVRSLGVPVVGPDAVEPFWVSVTFDPTEGEADLGPFEAESVTTPAASTLFASGLELVLPTESVTVTPVAIDTLEVRRNDGGRLEADNAVLRVPTADADALLAAFTGGLRLGDPLVRYLGPDGTVVMEVTADYGQIVAAAPDFTGGEAKTVLELEFETSTSSSVRIAAP